MAIQERTETGLSATGDDRLIEILTPLSNKATITPTETALKGMAAEEPFSLEIASSRRGHRFLARTRTAQAQAQLKSQLAANYPQADLTTHRFDEDGDPAEVRAGELVLTAVLELRDGEHLPLRTFTDLEIDDERNPQADPVLNILNAANIATLPGGVRLLSQLVLHPALPGWSRKHRHLAEEQPRPLETGGGMPFLIALVPLAVIGLWAWQFYREAQWLHLGGLAGGALLLMPVLFVAAMRLGRRTVPDPPNMVREKIASPGYYQQLRLSLIAPRGLEGMGDDELWGWMGDRLHPLATSYKAYDLEAGNGFAYPYRFHDTCTHDLRALAFLGKHPRTVLNTREIAGLWHLPQALSEVYGLRRTGARKIVPLPHLVARGTYVGRSEHQDDGVDVHLPVRVPAPHMLAVAKTRRGKSTWMQKMALEVMLDSERSLFLVDPQVDLARDVAAIVPQWRHEDTLYLNFGDKHRPVGFNLLDAGMGWGRDKIVSDVLSVFESEGGDSWGPRIEPLFGWSLVVLYEANQALLARESPTYDAKGERSWHPRQMQYTLLDIPRLYNDPGFREKVLEDVSDPEALDYWRNDYGVLSPSVREEYTNSVKNKIYRLARSNTAKAIVGQPMTTVEPREWLKKRQVVIIDTAQGEIGNNLARLLGGVLINLMVLLLREQTSEQRQRVTFIVDEFQSIPGAGYEAILSELAKNGANMILATQSLATLRTVDTPNKRRFLTERVFSNIDVLLVFETSAEDARTLLPELGGALTEADITRLDRYECYIQLSDARQKLPAFSCRLAPPLEGDPNNARALAWQAALKYGSTLDHVQNQLASSRSRAAMFKRGAPSYVTGRNPRPADVAQEALVEGEHETGRGRGQRTTSEPRPRAPKRRGRAEQLYLPPVPEQPEPAAGEDAQEVALSTSEDEDVARRLAETDEDQRSPERAEACALNAAEISYPWNDPGDRFSPEAFGASGWRDDE
ncbi:MAG: type IV secretion system DNA-binding domain-containing protein [Chloroflexota bacterium]|nr:type IV secretion system DNA-binding domain-containing protein [Chloroflexota bacterium]